MVKKIIFLITILMVILCISLNAQQKPKCPLIIIANVLNIEESLGIYSGRTAAYRIVRYSVESIINGNLPKKEIKVAHLEMTPRELDYLLVGDKVLLCLEKPKTNKKIIETALLNSDYRGDLLMVDCNCK